MNELTGRAVISDDWTLLQMDRVEAMLRTTYWGADLPRSVMEEAAAHSLCFGVYLDGRQVGYARAVTDYTTVYYLCDLVIDPAYRGQGLGKALVAYITGGDGFDRMQGLLDTRDAHGLYAAFGFRPDAELMMKHRERSLGDG